MKNLVDILLEKLDINKVRLKDGFPFDENDLEIIKFLKEHGFKDLKNSRAWLTEFEDAHDRCFKWDDNTEVSRICFADTSKKRISKENPIFYIEISFINDRNGRWNYLKATGQTVYDHKVCDKDEWLIEVNKHFDF